ncbi:HNH endonuclease [Cryobacterium luteum]|nr:HNH endonuclease signature motif containing protein [Cryobacterium luteum]
MISKSIAQANSWGGSGTRDSWDAAISLESATSLVTPALLVVLVGLALAAAWGLLVLSRRRFVSSASQALAQLDDLNSRWRMQVIPQTPIRLNYAVSVDSKAKFDRLDLASRMSLSILESEGWLEQEIQLRLATQARFAMYRFDFEALEYGLLGRSSHPRVSAEKFASIERKEFLHRKLDDPVPAANVSTRMTYSSPQGRNSYSSRLEWNFEQLRYSLAVAQKARANQSTTAALRQRERTLMTPGLRTKILRRDGFRCRMCGASANDGTTNLHVDHIIPVSLDGRTVPENLQTLCQSCNLGA